MAKISLRAYNREIERLIETGQSDQAIAHCRHIFKHFPKHVDTYRLLGKAYLESQRYGDAADIFQRVLSSVPEDFVSHVGMSIIREDEGNLDEALWHMERAFEIQPSNSAIQDELRRLYGKRDGLEPPKVRLTRGALARMYVKGNLFQQAIPELRAALAEDPNRLDLQGLLAEVYYKNGQRVEAAEVCSGLLRKLPFHLNANDLMWRILSQSERAEEAKNFKGRAQALNPYIAHMSPNTLDAEKVADQAVIIERLDWRPGEDLDGEGGQPEWAASLGVDVSGYTVSEEEDLPDWLKSAGASGMLAEGGEGAFDESETVSESEDEEFEAEDVPEWLGEIDIAGEAEDQAEEESEEIPEWMKEAGWAPATGAAEGSPMDFEEDDELETGPMPADEQEKTLEEGDLPDWLQSMAPEADEEASQFEDDLSWLESEEDAEEPAATQLSAPASESSLEDFDDEDELPDWLAEAQATETEQPESNLEIDEEASEELEEDEPLPEKEEPDWLAGLVQSEETEGTTGEDEDLPDWLKGIEAADEVPELEPADAQQVPEFLREVGEEETAEAIEAQYQAEEEIERLEELQSDQAPEFVLEEMDEDTVPPEWVEEAAQTGPQSGALTAPQTVSESEVEQTSEETQPEAGDEEVPAWLLESFSESNTEDQTEPPVEEEEAVDSKELPEWLLEGLAEDAQPPTIKQQEKPTEPEAETLEEYQAQVGSPSIEESEEVPDWLRESITEEETVESTIQEEAQPESVEAEEPAEFAAAQEEAVEEEPAEPVAETSEEETPEWVTQAMPDIDFEDEDEAQAVETVAAEEIPDWLTPSEEEEEEPEPPIEELQIETPELATAEPEEQADVLPDWLDQDVQSEPALEMEEAEDGEESQEAEEATTWPKAIEQEAEEEAVEQIASSDETEAETPEWNPDDMEAAYAWLESLAAKQGIEEGLLLDSEERQEDLPDWLLEIQKQEVEGTEPPELAWEELEMEAAQPEEETQELAASRASEEAETEEQPAEEEIEEAQAEELPGWLLEEAPLSEEDTKPTWVADMTEIPVPESEEPVAEAIEEEDLQPEMAEEPPAVSETAEMIETASPEEEWKPEEEFADLQTSTEAEISADETAELHTEEQWQAEMIAPADTQEVDIEGEAEEAEVEAEEQIPQFDFEDMDQAFAWLESLASKQGTEEGLLLTPEERQEEQPEWLQKAAQEAAEMEEFEGEEELPSLEETDLAALQEQEIEELEEEAPSFGEEEQILAEVSEPESSDLPDWLKAMDAAEGESSAVVEAQEADTEVEEVSPQDEIGAAEVEGEALPELPDWLSEAELTEEEELEWTPPTPVVDLNQASLSELERLPGIGFIMAQQILMHREQYGPYQGPEDLLRVPGFSQEQLDEIQEFVYVEGVGESELEPELIEETYPEAEGPFPALQEMQGEASPEISAARQALIDGDVNAAVERYQELVKKQEHLPEIISDLQEAINRYPIDVGLWQALGDAYLRMDRLQEALDAYSRAEELLG